VQTIILARMRADKCGLLGVPLASDRYGSVAVVGRPASRSRCQGRGEHGSALCSLALTAVPMDLLGILDGSTPSPFLKALCALPTGRGLQHARASSNASETMGRECDQRVLRAEGVRVETPIFTA